MRKLLLVKLAMLLTLSVLSGCLLLPVPVDGGRHGGGGGERHEGVHRDGGRR